MTEACPCCGQPIICQDNSWKWSADTRTVVANGATALLTKREAAVFDAIYRARRPLRPEELIDRAWADDPDGGPESINIAWVYARKISQKIARVGLRLGSRTTRDQGGIWIHKIDKRAA